MNMAVVITKGIDNHAYVAVGEEPEKPRCSYSGKRIREIMVCAK